MIELENITITFNQKQLFKTAALTVKKGEKIVLCGSSGSGKSSLLKAIVGAVPVQNGKILINKTELTPQNCAIIRSQIAYIDQEPILGADLVHQALLLPFHYKAHKKNPPKKKSIHALLDQLELPISILDQPTAQISGGEKQRIAIARALLLNKRIFLTDEITSALDPTNKQRVINKLFQDEITLLSISHDPEWIGICSSRYRINNGTLTKEPIS